VAEGLPDLAPLAPPSDRPHRHANRAVQAAVRTAIDDGRLKPGVRYSVYQLAEVLGVSRTPVREALLRLEEAGVIEFEARQGFRILLPRAGDIADIFAVRLALELPAVRQVAAGGHAADTLRTQRALMTEAASRGDEQVFVHLDQGLHDLILAAAGNSRARTIVRGLRETTRLLGAATADKTRTLVDIDDEHGPIVAAIVAGDPDAAAAAMEEHLVNTGKLLVAQALFDEHGTATPGEVEAVWRRAVY
jgi:DNA-binding GntR family transcriptional regulator